MIEIENLTKRYGAALAVDALSLTARPGEVTGLLGPNGAGKSTTIACLSGLRTPSSGRLRVLGRDVVRERRAALEQLGLVPQELALYEDLSARENLEYWGGAYGMRGAVLRRRVGDVLELVGLGERADERVSSFSGGMQRRLNFACALTHSPRVLLLDEPTVGVDPQSRVRLVELVRELARGGVTVLYTTHHMQEAEELCDRIAIVDHGKLIAEGALGELHAQLGERDLVQLDGRFPLAETRAALERLAREQGGLEVVSLDEQSLQLSLERASARLALLFGALTAAGAEVRESHLRRPSLEALFIALTGKALRE